MQLLHTITEVLQHEPQEVKDFIVASFKEIRLDKNEHFLQPGEVSDTIYFIEDGVAREYGMSKEETEETYWVLGEGHWVYAIESFVHQQPSRTYLQALTPVTLFCIPKRALEKVLEDFPRLYPVYIKLIENYLVLLEKRDRIHRIKNASMRLLVFENEYPQIANRVPLKIIASFLNITPQQLSHIRRKRQEIN